MKMMMIGIYGWEERVPSKVVYIYVVMRNVETSLTECFPYFNIEVPHDMSV